MLVRVLSRCQVCGCWPSRPICHACETRFAACVPRCPTCALRMPPGAPTHSPCGHCLRHPLPLVRCWAVVDYGYPWHTLLARFKFHPHPGWARPLAELALRHDAIATALQTADVVVPIPLSTHRLAERGYNQAWEWVKALRPQRAWPQALLRVGEGGHQVGQGRQARLQRMRHAFAVAPSALPLLQGCDVLLVDDVMTTGATLTAAADALLRSGAANVSGLCFARTPAD